MAKSRYKCFLIEETQTVDVWLRRFTFGEHDACPERGGYGHDAKLWHTIEEVERGAPLLQRRPSEEEKKAFPWPLACECGYAFRDDDEWQFIRRRLYRHAKTGECMSLDEAPVGAMWYATWRPKEGHLHVVTPGGQWDIDERSARGRRWEREGSPPNVTVTPSIIAGDYHGRLRGGLLIDA